MYILKYLLTMDYVLALFITVVYRDDLYIYVLGLDPSFLFHLCLDMEFKGECKGCLEVWSDVSGADDGHDHICNAQSW